MRALYKAEQDELLPTEHPCDRPSSPSDPPPYPVVGIGASAGGLRALQQLFAHMPADSGMAFVVILHLSPHQESRAAEVLQYNVSMPVTQSTRAIAIARGARYPKAISADVSAQRLQRFFVREDGHYHVQKALRDMVIFARQNLLRDPPISKLDLISCRNLLIYLAPDAQMRLLRVLPYALRPGGYLFLGKWEFADGQLGLFTPLDKQHVLFVRRGVAAQLPLNMLTPPRSTS